MYTLLFSIVRISTYEITAVDSVREEHNFSCKRCGAAGLYVMCYACVITKIPNVIVTRISDNISWMMSQLI